MNRGPVAPTAKEVRSWVRNAIEGEERPSEQEKIMRFLAARKAQGRNLSADTFRDFVRAAEKLPEKMWSAPPAGDMIPVVDRRGNEYLLENPEGYPGDAGSRGPYGEPMDPDHGAEWSAETVWLKIGPDHPDYPGSTDKRVIRDIADFMFDPPDEKGM